MTLDTNTAAETKFNPFAIHGGADGAIEVPKPERVSAYERVTQSIMRMLEAGVIPWRKSWVGADMAPRNPLSEVWYRGSNVLFLWISMMEQGWSDPRFATFDQIKKANGSVNRGSSATPCIRWQRAESRKNFNPDGSPERYEFAKAFYVFNLAEQTDLELEPLLVHQREDATPHADCELIAQRSGVDIEYAEGNKPCYLFKRDVVQMPERTQFESDVAFEAVRFHELVHATGSKGRLDRDGFGVEQMTPESYSKEELTAEIGSAFLMSMVGIEDDSQCIIENQASYIQGWLNRLGDEPGLVVAAASKAQAAADYLLNTTAQAAKAA